MTSLLLARRGLNDQDLPTLLASHDIEGSRAHVTMLAEVSILTAAERDSVLAALAVVADELEAGTFAFVPSDEDIHTAVATPKRKFSNRVA